MSNGWSTHRTIVEEVSASTSIDKLTQEYERFDDQWEGFKWLICRSPELSRRKEVNGREFHLLHRAGEPDFGLVGISVVFIYDDNAVTIIDVAAWEEEDEPTDP